MAISFGGRAPTETLSNQESINNISGRNGLITDIIQSNGDDSIIKLD